VNTDGRSGLLHDEGGGNGAKPPRKIEKADASGNIFGRKLRGPQVGGGIGESVTKAIESDGDRGKRPRADAEKGHSQTEKDETKSQHLRGVIAGNEPTGGDDSKHAGDVLRREKESCLGISEGPLAREDRKRGGEDIGDDADEDEARM